MAKGGKTVLYVFLICGLVLIAIDHLTSPSLSFVAESTSEACAPCGAPCPSTR